GAAVGEAQSDEAPVGRQPSPKGVRLLVYEQDFTRASAVGGGNGRASVEGLRGDDRRVDRASVEQVLGPKTLAQGEVPFKGESGRRRAERLTRLCRSHGIAVSRGAGTGFVAVTLKSRFDVQFVGGMADRHLELRRLEREAQGEGLRARNRRRPA